MTKKSINLAIKRLILNLGDNPSTAKINVALRVFHKEIVELTTKERMQLMERVVKMLKDRGLNNQKAVEIASTWAISTAKYNAEGKLVSAYYDIEEALDKIPLNMTSKVQGIVRAWQSSVENYSLHEEFKRAKTAEQVYKNVAFLGKTYFTQAMNNLKFYRLPEHTPIVYISIEDSKRDDVCGMLHGTVWNDKTEIPEVSKVMIHPNCRCKLIALDESKSEYVIIPYDTAPQWVLDMLAPNKGDGSNRLYGQGYSNFQLVEEDGSKYSKYIKDANGKRVKNTRPKYIKYLRVLEK